MREYKPILTSELIEITNNGLIPIGKAQPYYIKTYRDLIKQIALLSYLNKDYLLFFRGQTQDYLNKAGVSTFYPSIYREENLSRQEVNYSFEILDFASKQLKELFTKKRINGFVDVSRKRYIQWSILQHYEVCKTPLLDFTHSIRVACSFAQLETDYDYSFIYVFGLPYITNRISINSEQDIINIRLLSICPPDALRPYFQEGYLAGTTDVTNDYESKSELDFNNRLIAKFAIPNTKSFWGSGLNKIPNSMLFPKNDQIQNLCKNIETSIPTGIHSGITGNFLAEWIPLEQALLQKTQIGLPRSISIREAINYLINMQILNKQQGYQIDELRKFRNTLVHDPIKINENDIHVYLLKLRELKQELKWSTSKISR